MENFLRNSIKSKYIFSQEIPKTPDHAPSRTFYLFSVDLNAVARMLLDTAYKSVGNVISRRLHETKENKLVSRSILLSYPSSRNS